MRRKLLVLLFLLGIGMLIPSGAALAATSSANVALVPSANGQAHNGGNMPTSGFPNSYAPAFTNVTLASIQNDATDPLANYDTVALVQVCDIGNYLANAQFKSRLEGFVSRGGKLLIWDSECQNTDYSNFVYPFTTSNPGAAGANGTLTIAENNTIGSTDPTSPYYIDANAISTGTDAVGDANVFTSYSQDWCAASTATNILGVNGPVIVYARSGSGLIIYTGLDMDTIGSSSSFDATSTSGYTQLNRVWYLQLLQSFNPDSGLPCGIKVFGLALSPKTASNSEGTSHTVTAAVTSNAAPQSGADVTFQVTSGPNKGQTATVKTGTDGTAKWTYTDSGGFGTDTIQASTQLKGAGGQSTTVSDTATKSWTELPISAQGTSLTAMKGQSLTAVVAKFSDPFTGAKAGEYSATIDWGDGKTSAGTIGGSAGSFTVTGTHTYANAGSYTAKVTITDTDTPSNSKTVNTTITVKAPALVLAVKVIRGAARLSGIPRACVRAGATLRITGKRIASVTWFVDGRRITGRRIHAGTAFVATIRGGGSHRVTVKVRFVAASHTRVRTLHATLTGCRALPRFTG